MRNLNYQLKQLCRKYHEGGFATRRDREYTLSLIADQLHAAGFRHLRVERLKGRHVSTLLEKWKMEGLNPGTIKNRMSTLHWWAVKIGKSSVISRDNAHYGI
ncbi:MAG: integrase, partial [Methylococcaceae bacterium]|nr:integrase [Methylococcaceae bacterium]